MHFRPLMIASLMRFSSIELLAKPLLMMFIMSSGKGFGRPEGRILAIYSNYMALRRWVLSLRSELLT